MATYNRGRHILPSIRSVERQTFRNFELVVVGDDCTDETADVVRELGSEKIRWLNLDPRGGSQSFPNNAGIDAARGAFIAYIGHDDIWAPGHLEALLDLFAKDPALGIGVSGAIFHLPNDMPGSQVTGLFDDDEAKFTHFFPPSSFAHRKELTRTIGAWRSPLETRPPVDVEFLVRAANAGLRFASTGRITVHKFAAGHRYLSYVRHESHEQEAILQKMRRPGFDDDVAAIVDAARSAGSFMAVRYRDFSALEPGQLARENAVRKGMTLPPLQPVGSGHTIEQRPALCALDWRDLPEDGIRWANGNPRPRFLIPFTSDRPARLSILLTHADKDALRTLALTCNGAPLVVHLGKPVRAREGRQATASATVRLMRDDYSILEFGLCERQVTTPGHRGIGIGPIGVRPLRFSDRLRDGLPAILRAQR